MRSERNALLVMACVAVVLVSCGGSSPENSSPPTAAVPVVTQAPGPSSDSVLTLAYPGLAADFPDPVEDEFESYVGDGEYLLRPVDGGTEPWLAQKVEMVDPKTWKITMRAGLKYQNGNAVTIAKVKSWLDNELGGSPEFGSKYKGVTTTISGDNTLTVNFPKPESGFATDMSSYALHFYDWEAVQSVGASFNKLAGMGVYTGPYQISEITPTKWVYTANPNYWQGTPALAKIELLDVADAKAGVEAVRSGAADIAVSGDADLKATVDATAGLHFNSGPSAEYIALIPNSSKAPWNDPVVRQALAMTVDSAKISLQGSAGVMPALAGLFPSASTFAYDWMKPDVAAANKLLDGAGWKLGADGVRVKGNVRLVADLLSYTKEMNGVGVPLADGAKAAGFALTPKLLDYQAWGDAVTAGNFQLALQDNENFGINGNVAITCDRYFGIDEEGPSKGDGNDPDISKACSELINGRDAKTLARVLAAVQKRNAKQAYIIPVVERVSSWITNDAWQGTAPDAFYVPITWQTKAG